jgi:hypothetical protein
MGTLVQRRRACDPHGVGMKTRRWPAILWLRVRSLLRRIRVERELEKELLFHIDQEIEDGDHFRGRFSSAASRPV